MPLIQSIKLPYFQDERGGFTKVFQQNLSELADFHIRQINLVDNPQAGILRGLHAQSGEAAETKIFRVLQGSIQLMAVSPEPPYTSETQILKPGPYAWRVQRGCYTGYLTLEAHTQVLYLSDRDYAPQSEKGLGYNDPSLKLVWQGNVEQISEKDQNWPKI